MKQFLGLLLALLMSCLCACHAAPQQQIPELLEPVGTKPQVTIAEKGNLVSMKTLTGCVVPYAEGVAFRVGGQIGKVNVLPGQHVSEGEVLAVLNVEGLELALSDLEKERENFLSSSALSRENLNLNAKICTLRLEDLISRNQKEMKQMDDGIQILKDQIAALEAQAAEPTEEMTEEPSEPTETETEPEGPSVQQQLEQLRGELQQAEKEREAMAGRHTTEEKLSRMDLEDAQRAMEHAQTNQTFSLEKLDRDIETLRRQLDNAEITAPFDGIVSWISTSAYMNGSVNVEEPFLFVSDPERMTVRTDRLLYSELDQCSRVFAKIHGQEYDLIPRQTDAKEDIAKTLNGVTLSTTFTFESDPLPSGENVPVYLIFDTRENVLNIPVHVIHSEHKQKYVYCLVDGEKVRKDIELGLTTELRAEVVSGLQEGDAVYVAD